jgi:hypothetical protein
LQDGLYARLWALQAGVEAHPDRPV